MPGKLIEPPEILKGALDGREVGEFVLETRDFRRGRTDRETYFNLFLRHSGRASSKPVVQGLFFMGRGDYIKPWMEFRYDPLVSFPGESPFDLEEMGLTDSVFSLLGSLIPAGGSLMVIYGAEDHPFSRETESGLKRKFPPPATPMGYRLWKAGFRWFKDWYFPEGWLEGAMKLQATRPLDEGIRALRESQARKELEAFVLEMRRRAVLDREAASALLRAEEILKELGSP